VSAATDNILAFCIYFVYFAFFVLCLLVFILFYFVCVLLHCVVGFRCCCFYYVLSVYYAVLPSGVPKNDDDAMPESRHCF